MSIFNPAFIKDMRILIRDHFRLCMSRIPLNSLDVAAIKLQLLRDTRMPQTMKNDFRQIILLDQFLEPVLQAFCFCRSSF